MTPPSRACILTCLPQEDATMQIKAHSTGSALEEIVPGTSFLLDGVLYMTIEPVTSVLVGNIRFTAVNLKTGKLEAIPRGTRVRMIDATVSYED